MNRTEIAEHTFRDLSRNRNEPMTNPTTEADSQTRTIRGVVRGVGLANMNPGYRAEVVDEHGDVWHIILGEPTLRKGQTYEVEVTVREVG